MIMNNKKQESIDIPGRAPVDEIWDRIEKHLNDKVKQKDSPTLWPFALAVFFFSAVMAVVVLSGFIIHY
jgi:hypothetical protein